jgi:hypothetical protein
VYIDTISALLVFLRYVSESVLPQDDMLYPSDVFPLMVLLVFTRSQKTIFLRSYSGPDPEVIFEIVMLKIMTNIIVRLIPNRLRKVNNLFCRATLINILK